MAGGNQRQLVKGIFVARVLANGPICREHFKLVLETEDFPPAEPGQFVQLLCADPGDRPGSGGILLRRPFSIGGLRRKQKKCQMDIYLQVVGQGTRWLSQLKPDDTVSVLGPLGNPFEIFEDRASAYLVGGGCGLPPLIWLAESLQGSGKRTTAFCGARSADRLPLTRMNDVQVSGAEPALGFEEFARCKVPVVAGTDDGTLGATGLISDLFADYLDRQQENAEAAVVYTCGPNPMMRAVADLCHKRSIPCLVCLERTMGCGMGTCQSCVVRTRHGDTEDNWQYKLCCTDGPTFDSRVVIWDE